MGSHELASAIEFLFKMSLIKILLEAISCKGK